MTEPNKAGAGHLTVLRGLPGSGKSTLARSFVKAAPDGRLIVSRDAFRSMFRGGGREHGHEDLITTLTKEAARAALRAGKSVVVDETNLPHRRVREWLSLAVQEGAGWEVCDLTNIPLETCLEWNGLRPEAERVPEEVIRNMHKRFIAGREVPLPSYWTPVGASSQLDVEPYVPDEAKPLALIVDIDGTLAKMSGRGPHEYDRVGEDAPAYPVIKLVDEWWHGAYEDWVFGVNNWGNPPKVILMSGRPESCRKETEAWLREHGVLWGHLFMRSDREHRDGVADDKVKLRLFNEHVRDNYNVRAVLDDRDRVVKMWRKLGLTCLQVAEGAF